ncbi:MAG: hypothetical protein QM774_05035 [Gordonia sp. (in: high G+C Gram-positive bacteria)]|uniref:hypothetical protein n=1 Tax=Gordonia sp. (in: high G+C Gram-positive bacteria) TaxID=84139 RepID=UPI0039E508B7
MSNTITRMIAVGAVTAATLTGAAVAASAADAQVAQGRYRSTTVVFGVTNNGYLAVNGSTLTSFTGPLGTQRYHIVATRSGGFVDAYGARFILDRRAGDAYGGPVYVGPVVVGNTHLRPSNR